MRTSTPMAFAIRWILVWVCWMIVAYAMVLERCTNVDATCWLKMHAIAKATNSTPWMNVAVHAKPTKTAMVFATTWMTALASWMHAVCAMVQERCSNADATTSLTVPAIAMATNLTPWVNVAVHAKPTKTTMVFATTKTIAWVSWTHVACAMAQVQ